MEDPGGPRAVPPAEALAQAQANPGGHVYVIGGGYGSLDETPFSAIVGWWKVDDDGEIRQPFEENADYDAQTYPRTSPKI